MPPMFVPNTTTGVNQSDPSRNGKRSKRPAGEYGEADGRVPSNGPSRSKTAQNLQQYPNTQNDVGHSRRPTFQASQSHSQLQNKYPYIESDLLGIGASGRVIEPTSNSNRARIIPGASPTHRVIPPQVPPLPKFLRNNAVPPGDTDHQTQDWPKDRHSRRHRNDDRRRSLRGMDELASRGPGRSHGTAAASLSDGEDSVKTRLVSASAFVSGYGAGYDEGYGYASVYHQGYMPARQDGYAARRPASSEGGVGGLGLLGVPGGILAGQSDSPDDMTTPRPRHTESHPRVSTGSYQLQQYLHAI